MTDKKSRRNPFTRCREHARLSNSVKQCLYENNPYKGAWINEFNRIKQIDFLEVKNNEN